VTTRSCVCYVYVCVIGRVNPLAAKSLNLQSNCIGVWAKSALRAVWRMRDSDELCVCDDT